jgi:NAD-dependent dihydropyrimidine dehydrogenase PreA subunit
MSIKKISKKDFGLLVDELLRKVKVYGVKSRGDRFEFGPLESAKDLRLDYDVTLQPPKIFFQPPCETLVTYRGQENYKTEYDCEKFVLLGVHPYDMIALNQMDKLFSKDNCDEHYFARRNNATIVACDVVTPSKDVFAASMNTAVVREGFDVLLTDIGDSYIAEAATKKGEELLAQAKNAKEAAKDDLQKRQNIWDKNKKDLNKHQLKCSVTYLSKLLDRAYDNPVWEEKAKTCFSCGSCNQVCPTCYCFNVQDETNWDLKSGKRNRSWDGCLLDGFTKVAGNHEFRKNRADRFRHRLYRKGKYVPAKIELSGQVACVGCGRCVSACLPDIANPVNVYNKLIDEIGIV